MSQSGAEKKVFPGVGVYLDALKAEGVDRANVNNIPLLQELADIVGQAYASPENAAGIIAAAAERRAPLTLADRAAGLILADARKDLLAPKAKG